MTDLNHRTHEETSALKDLEELAAQFEDKCGEASTWKTNFEKLQIDFGERTSELESLNSQLHKAKQVGTIYITIAFSSFQSQRIPQNIQG